MTEAYAHRDWPATMAILDNFKTTYPYDPLAPVIAQRVGGFIEAPPSAEWDGVTRFDSK